MLGQKSKAQKILIIGIDGATFDLIKPWITQGRLPGFASLIDNGVHSELQSTVPPITPTAWTSFMTGKNPGNHHLFDFIQLKPGSYEFHYTNGGFRKGDSLWRVLNNAEKTAGIFNVPMTYPPERIDGFVISGLDTPDYDTEFIYPGSLKKEFEDVFGGVELDIRHLGYMTSDKKRDQVLESLRRVERQRTDIALYLMEKYPVDVFMITFTATDTVQHFFWHYMDEKHPLHDPKGAKKYSDAILAIYQEIDRNIIRLCEKIDSNTLIVLMSDHGAGPADNYSFNLNDYLSRNGYLSYKQKINGKVSLISDRAMSLIDGFLRGKLTPGQKSTIAKLFPALREKWEQRISTFSNIDWGRTTAFCLDILSFPSGIWLNVKNRMPSGIVEESDYENVLNRLEKDLYALQHPTNGNRLIRRIYRKGEIFSGAYMQYAPDLVISWWEENSPFFSSAYSGAVASMSDSFTEKEFSQVARWTGTHRLNGILIMNGPGVPRGGQLKHAEIIDVAPTILFYLGIPVPDDMDGRPLMNAFTGQFLQNHHVRYQSVADTAREHSVAGASYSDRDAKKIEDRLKSLGYL